MSASRLLALTFLLSCGSLPAAHAQATQQAAPAKPVTSRDLEVLSPRDIQTVIKQEHESEKARLESIVNKNMGNAEPLQEPKPALAAEPVRAVNAAPAMPASSAVPTTPAVSSPAPEAASVPNELPTTVEPAATAVVSQEKNIFNQQLLDTLASGNQLDAQTASYIKKLTIFIKWLVVIGIGQFILLVIQLWILSRSLNRKN